MIIKEYSVGKDMLEKVPILLKFFEQMNGYQGLIIVNLYQEGELKVCYQLTNYNKETGQLMRKFQTSNS